MRTALAVVPSTATASIALHGRWRRSIGGRPIDTVPMPGGYEACGACELATTFALPAGWSDGRCFLVSEGVLSQAAFSLERPRPRRGRPLVALPLRDPAGRAARGQQRGARGDDRPAGGLRPGARPALRGRSVPRHPHRTTPGDLHRRRRVPREAFVLAGSGRLRGDGRARWSRAAGRRGAAGRGGLGPGRRRRHRRPRRTRAVRRRAAGAVVARAPDLLPLRGGPRQRRRLERRRRLPRAGRRRPRLPPQRRAPGAEGRLPPRVHVPVGLRAAARRGPPRAGAHPPRRLQLHPAGAFAAASGDPAPGLRARHPHHRGAGHLLAGPRRRGDRRAGGGGAAAHRAARPQLPGGLRLAHLERMPRQRRLRDAHGGAVPVSSIPTACCPTPTAMGPRTRSAR